MTPHPARPPHFPHPTHRSNGPRHCALALLAALAAAVSGCASGPDTVAPPSASRYTANGGGLLGAGSGLGALPSMSLSKPGSLVGGSRVAATSATVDLPSPLGFASLGPDAQRTAPDAQEPGGNEAVVGAPTDPLRPDVQLDFSDTNAHRDLWSRVRVGFQLPALDTELVGTHERWYAGRPDYVQRMTDRGSRYLFHVVEEVEKRRMPTELALLPFIESAFNPQAMSSARASGIWQFMPATGKDFELTQNLFRDDRRDVLASTRAALDYLQRLHKQFGDWNLALAAYNWGEGNLQRSIQKNARAGLPTDYLSLNMPPETRNYVPKLQAVRNIVAQPQAFGLKLAPIENHPYFVSVPIQRDMDVALAARLAQMPLGEFQSLNPSMNKPVILAAGTPQILLPYENASKFLESLPQFKGNYATWTAWTVPHTMRPLEAARQVGTSEQSLRSINLIPDRMLVKAGSTLLVPRTAQRSADVPENVADNATMQLAPDVPPLKRITVTTRRIESVAAVAKRYKVSEEQVAQWNKVRPDASFRKSQTVVLYVANKAPTHAGGRTVVALSQAPSPGVSASARATRHNGAGRAASPTRQTVPAARSTRPVASNHNGTARPTKVRIASSR